MHPAPRRSSAGSLAISCLNPSVRCTLTSLAWDMKARIATSALPPRRCSMYARAALPVEAPRSVWSLSTKDTGKSSAIVVLNVTMVIFSVAGPRKCTDGRYSAERERSRWHQRCWRYRCSPTGSPCPVSGRCWPRAVPPPVPVRHLSCQRAPDGKTDLPEHNSRNSFFCSTCCFVPQPPHRSAAAAQTTRSLVWTGIPFRK